MTVIDYELNSRTIRKDVEFRRPFILSGLDGPQPPGIYRVETHERLLDTVSVTAYQRVTTSIELHGQAAGIIRTATIDPEELEAALARDALPGEANPTGEPRGL